MALELTLDLKKVKIGEPQFVRAVERGTRRSMFKSLAMTRKQWRSTFKRRKKPSPPGQPPHVHRKGLGLKTVLFSFDARQKVGVVGPVKLFGKPSSKTSNTALPGLLEKGGNVSIRVGKKKSHKIRRRIAARPHGAPVAKWVAGGNAMDPWAGMVTS